MRELRHDSPSGRFSKSRGLSPSFLPPPLPALLFTPFFARSLTLVPRSLLLNRTETPATQATILEGTNSWYLHVDQQSYQRTQFTWISTRHLASWIMKYYFSKKTKLQCNTEQLIAGLILLKRLQLIAVINTLLVFHLIGLYSKKV